MTDEQTPAEKAAQAGTVEACWIGYLENVLQPMHRLAGLPQNVEDHEYSARLDFYAGASTVFQILRCMYERGDQPNGNILADLETEVATFLAGNQPRPGHA